MSGTEIQTELPWEEYTYQDEQQDLKPASLQTLATFSSLGTVLGAK